MQNIHKLIEMIKSTRPTKAPASTSEEKTENISKELPEIIEEEKFGSNSDTPEETA